MAIDSSNQRRIFSGHSLAWLASCLLATVAATLLGSTAQASIVCPELATIELEDLLPAADVGTSSGSRSAPAEEPSEDGNEQELARLLSPSAIPSSGSTSGTSSSGSGAGGSNATALGSVAAIVLCDADVVRWVAGEQRLTLPTPPGNDLLRPPQSA
jgi:hypothetical protein